MATGFKGLLDFVGYRVGRSFSIQNNNLDLFIHGKDSFSTNLNLFINGKDSLTDNLNLFIQGKDNKTQDLNLFIHGHEVTKNNKLYVSDSTPGVGYIKKINNDGSDPINILNNQAINILHIDTKNKKLYYVRPGTVIRKSNLDGTNIQSIFSSGISIFGLEIDQINDKLYFCENGIGVSGHIFRTNLDGTNFETLVSSSYPIYNIVADPLITNKIYYSQGDNTINKANLDGTNKEIFASGASIGIPVTMDIDILNQQLYFNTDNQYIKRINLDGSNLETIFDANYFFDPTQISFDSNHRILYWADLTNQVFGSGSVDNLSSGIVYNSNLPFGIFPLTLFLELFISAFDIKNENIDLFINGSDSETNGFNLFVHGKDIESQNLDSFIRGLDNNSKNIDLTIIGNESENNNLNLFIDGHIFINNNLTLFINTSSEENDILDLFLKVPEPINNNVSLFINGFAAQIKGVDLFVNGKDNKNNNIDLFINGKDNFNNNLNLFVKGKDNKNQGLNLFINGFNINNSSINLTIIGYESFNDNFDLFIHGSNALNELLDLYIFGVYKIQDNIDLFLKVKEAKQLDLVIHGRNIPSVISCPILDPTASIQISDDLIHIYQSRIDALINQLGKNVLLIFDPIIESCPNCTQDIINRRSTGIYKIGGPIPFSRGQKCPYCKGHGFLEREVNKCIKCLTQWNPRDARNYGISVSDPEDIVRLKTFLTDADSIVKAKYAIVNHDIENIIKMKVELIRGPVIVGLRESRYIITFWRLIDS